jgi:DNA processing protein
MRNPLLAMTQIANGPTFQQRSLFGASQDKQPPELTDKDRDNLLRTVMGLSSIKGVGFTTLCTLFDAQILHQVLEWDSAAVAEYLPKFASKLQKVDLAQELLQNRRKLEDAGDKAVETLLKEEVAFLPYGHQNYPEALFRLQTPPRWMFAKGNIATLHGAPIIGVVGTRTPSSDGLKLAYRFAKELAFRNATVLSGLAEGIDERAHLGSVDHYGQSIAILGHGLNTALTKRAEALIAKIVETDGVVISEYLPPERPSRERYLRRNELQAALSKVIVPVECPLMSSGTGATIRRAMKIGTQVIGIVPGNPQDKSILATRKNLENLNHRVFTVLAAHSTDLWEYFQLAIPNHDWSVRIEPLQDRFFNTIEREILKRKGSLALTSEAISRFVTRLQSQFEK